MADKYNENHTIACYEADANQLLKPIAMLDWMQEIAGRDATKLGFGYDNLIQNNTAWVLSRTHVRFHQYPQYKQFHHDGHQKIHYLNNYLCFLSAKDYLKHLCQS